MAQVKVQNISLRGLAGCVPKGRANSDEFSELSAEDRQKFIKTTGIVERRVAGLDQCNSDFCQAAAEQLIKDLGWRKE